ncbi:MAG: hypothetical protein V3V35_06830 [Dehalococcoidia bacterium]
MTSEEAFHDSDHFEEGLVHLADMLELSDPRRSEAKESQKKIQQTGLAVPVGGTYEEWKRFCLDVATELKATLAQATSDDARATIDAAIDRIEQMVQ